MFFAASFQKNISIFWDGHAGLSLSYMWHIVAPSIGEHAVNNFRKECEALHDIDVKPRFSSLLLRMSLLLKGAFHVSERISES
jgi:hypothetical protein